MASLFTPETDGEILSCFDAFKALRPHIEKEGFLQQVRRQQAEQYRIIAIKDGDKVVSAAGFRFAEFLAWGKVLYVDDLTTLSEARGKGHASRLIDWLIQYAKENQCNELHLDSGYARHAAHRLYLNKGLEMKSHHFAIQLKELN